ncbi:glycosyltransferase [Sanguibacter antarcticus]|uniref:D-inositol 3-phosphate glycosyltransferase n=1 Tax=Sanguibacter antarcticus TaxID=372484 RepID=A0A2A9E083_9MICO|nr:glycosyltransferase [Sanguibacter antarcticus]PFG32338.1 GT2 family glycosyltransferase [Sanguibacter antarcticus]
MRVLRISHSAVVDAWRERERHVRAAGHPVRSVSATVWDEGGSAVWLVPGAGEDVVGIRTFGSHPITFLYDPVALWRELGRPHTVLDIHEEPYSLAAAEILLLRALRPVRAPYLLYSAQNITKTHPLPFRWIERLTLRGASAVSVCNDEAGRVLRGKGLRAPAWTIGLGVDTATFHPAPAGTRAVRHPGGPIRVGFVGRLEVHKGVHVLVRAAARDVRLHVSIAGGGPLEATIRERVARPDLAGRVELVGHLSGERLAEHVRSLDVLAVPSLPQPGWVEQFGRVAVEAMASGVPVVASDSGALPDVLQDAGLLVPAGDVEALRDALVTVGTHPGLREELVVAGLARSADYTWENIGAQYLRVYREVATASTPVDAPHRPRPDELTPTTSDLEIVVVAYGSVELLDRALAPLSHTYRVIVVDNSSSPLVRALCERHGVRYLDPGLNSGFAAGANHGLQECLTPDVDVLLLNPDAVVEPQDVDLLREALHADPGLASVGPAQVDADGHAARVAWPFPTPLRTWLINLGLGSLTAQDDFVIGSVLLVRGAALADVGGLDERFFLYAEETDWARRARHAGWRHGVVPGARAVHLGGATSSDSRLRETHFHASQELYFRKHFGASGWAVNRLGVLAGTALRMVLLRGERRADATRRFVLYARGPARVQRTLLARP